MMIDFDRSIVSDLAIASRREWLVTNGIGGYASSTLAGMHTRRYHGLLVAALKPPLGRTILVSKLDETAEYGTHRYPLFTNHWESRIVEPNGYAYTENFELDGTTPVWTYTFADASLEKRIWMQPGANTTYLKYDLTGATQPLTLRWRALANYRDYHGDTGENDFDMTVEPMKNGIRLKADLPEAIPFYILSETARAEINQRWVEGIFWRQEEYRGEDPFSEDMLHVADFEVSLQPGDSVTLVATTEEKSNLDGARAFAERRAYENALIAQSPYTNEPEWVRQLVLAADQFVVKRSSPTDPDGNSVIAGYHWFGDWGRDTMIALPGLTLNTHRHDVARSILRVFSHFISQGMLPNRFPDVGEEPEYNTVDATLWYFEAIRAYYEAAQDKALVEELFPKLKEIIEWHRKGTRYNIRLDNEDGLIYAGEKGVQLTWMDAKVDDWVVTPRIGKPVEVNALWFNALNIMDTFAQLLGEDEAEYQEMARKAAAGFARFWNNETGYCYDVLDTPDGTHDAALRPNQIFAVALPHSPLTDEQQKAVVDICASHLLTSYGLRSLSDEHPDYRGVYGGARRVRDGAYHQGTVWSWLIGPFIRAHLRVYQNPETAQAYLRPLVRQMESHGVGSVSEIFDGDPPFTPRGCIAQAWSVAELLHAWSIIKQEEETNG
jgi:predicted glycogen debranching enzyme